MYFYALGAALERRARAIGQTGLRFLPISRVFSADARRRATRPVADPVSMRNELDRRPGAERAPALLARRRGLRGSIAAPASQPPPQQHLSGCSRRLHRPGYRSGRRAPRERAQSPGRDCPNALTIVARPRAPMRSVPTPIETFRRPLDANRVPRQSDIHERAPVRSRMSILGGNGDGAGKKSRLA